jgi:hypothetical protein
LLRPHHLGYCGGRRWRLPLRHPPSFVGRRRHPMRRFGSSPPFGGRLRWRLPRLQASGVAGNGGRQENPFSFDKTVEGRGREEAKLVYSMLSFRLHIQVKSTWWLPKQWAWQDLKTTGKTKGQRFLINCYTHAPGESSSSCNASPAPDSCMQNHTKGVMSEKVCEKLCIAK